MKHLNEKKGWRTKMFQSAEDAKNDIKSWASEKVYGSGPRY